MILIRADANEIIGSGHVMRCLSVAKELAKRKEKVLFVTADHRGDNLIIQNGFETVCMDSEWTQMDAEVPKLMRLIDEYRTKLLLVDSYFATGDYFYQLSKKIRVACFDDLNLFPLDVNYLINYNIYASAYDYSRYKSTRTELITTPVFAPLREEFRGLKKHFIADNVKDVLVSAGGSDPEGISIRLMKEVCPKHREIRFHFVIGLLNPRIEEIKRLEADNIILHINEKKMSELMETCDIAVSAAGTTLYELCAVGIPAMTYVLADNQIVAAQQFDEQGIMLNLGDCRNDFRFIQRVEAAILELAGDRQRRKALSEKMQSLVDGCGAQRIADRLIVHNQEVVNHRRK